MDWNNNFTKSNVCFSSGYGMTIFSLLSNKSKEKHNSHFLYLNSLENIKFIVKYYDYDNRCMGLREQLFVYHNHANVIAKI